MPLDSQNQLDHMNRELVQSIQRLGHSDVVLRCDNEPAILQLQRLATKTRQSMGLKTRMDNSVAYDHGNSFSYLDMGLETCSMADQSLFSVEGSHPLRACIWQAIQRRPL